jgi:uncharacterized protein YyaL (SSP411 family)
MNRLSKEKSPYLLQHSNNPVDWFAWSPEAFKAAKDQNKPIFLSIGYSTCYWCHVMEKDSFEKEEVASVLNKYFISIKIDREERPDVDQIYMDTVTGLTGHGGWPMSVFLTPDLRPFWGGTFFYRAQFISILEQINAAWEKDRNALINTSEKIVNHLNEHLKFDNEINVSANLLDEICGNYLYNLDSVYGGFGSAPKFPPSMQLSFLLRNYHKTKNEELLSAAKLTLDGMAKGGIFDQLGGGFHRYSTDRPWLTPHFEKMLYDNALLAVTYLEAFQITKDQNYLQIADEILAYLLTEMKHEAGGFFAGEDAGDVGKEGEFYVWKSSELQTILNPEEFTEVQLNFGITEEGNFEHSTNILAIPLNTPLIVKNRENMRAGIAKMLNARSLRERPHRDEKVITAWCALTITAFAKAYMVSGKLVYLEAAEKAASFIEENLFSDGLLYRHYCNGRSNIPGFLEDYSFYIEALLNLYQASFEPRWIRLAEKLQEIQDNLFWDKSEGGYFSSTAPELFMKKKEYIDGATPCGNSVAYVNLQIFLAIKYSEAINEKLEKLTSNFSAIVTRYKTASPKFLQGLQQKLAGTKYLIISSPDIKSAIEDLVKLSQDFRPFLITLREDSKENVNSYSLCEKYTCSLPEKDFQKLLDKLAI